MFEIQEELEITGGTCENKIWYKYIMASGRQKGWNGLDIASL